MEIKLSRTDYDRLVDLKRRYERLNEMTKIAALTLIGFGFIVYILGTVLEVFVFRRVNMDLHAIGNMMMFVGYGGVCAFGSMLVSSLKSKPLLLEKEKILKRYDLLGKQEHIGLRGSRKKYILVPS